MHNKILRIIDRAPYDLKNGYFVETNLSAESIVRFFQETINDYELSSNWKIEVAE